MIIRAFGFRIGSLAERLSCRALCSSLPIYDDSRQHGYGKIVAASSPKGCAIATNLTEISHSSPMRLVPSRRSHPTQHHRDLDTKYEAAIVHLSSYGGGFVPGDIIDLDIDVRGHGAIVYVLTQGGTRIYRPGDQFRQHINYRHQNQEHATFSSDDARRRAKLCQSAIRCIVDPGATLLFLPDPTVPYFQTSFQEHRVFDCKYIKTEDGSSMGSIIAVDWYAAGRRNSTGMEEERWAFDYLSTKTELAITNLHTPEYRQRVLIESMTLDNTDITSTENCTLSPAAISMGKTHDSYATLLLHGPNSLEVAQRATKLTLHLAGLQTRVRKGDFDESTASLEGESPTNDELDLLQLSSALGGKVIMSSSPIEKLDLIDNQEECETQTHVVRILAESNEDIYRILHFCLRPCSKFLGGLEPYKDRIYSSGTVRNIPTKFEVASRSDTISAGEHKRPEAELRAITNSLLFGGDKTMDDTRRDNTWFYSCLFSDSALPIGSFAHSLGMESASQLGLFREDCQSQNSGKSSYSEDDLADYIYAVSRSNAQFSTPIILGGYLPMAHGVSVQQAYESWVEIDKYTDLLLRSNGPGRRASMDQGLGFLRIAPALLSNNDISKTSNVWEGIRTSINDQNTSKPQDLLLDGSPPLQSAKGHAAPIYGMLAGDIGIPPLDACRVFSFGAARDSVSAAVRLNLIGPVAGLSLLNRVGRAAVEEGLEKGLLSMAACTIHGDSVIEQYRSWLSSASTCAPLMDVVQPCHDLLSVRLFRT
jgi:urease accessory protein UreF/urease accessory protein UreH